MYYFKTKWIHNYKINLTLVKSLTGSYPVDFAHSLVEIRLMSPSSFDALALASASIGSPTKQTRIFNYNKYRTKVSSTFWKKKVTHTSHLYTTHSEFKDKEKQHAHQHLHCTSVSEGHM